MSSAGEMSSTLSPSSFQNLYTFHSLSNSVEPSSQHQSVHHQNQLQSQVDHQTQSNSNINNINLDFNDSHPSDATSISTVLNRDESESDKSVKTLSNNQSNYSENVSINNQPNYFTYNGKSNQIGK